MTTTWYRIGWNDDIEPVEVVKETDSYLILAELKYNGKNRRVEKGDDWHPTREAAIDFIIRQSEERVRSAQAALDEALVHDARVREEYVR